MKKKKIKKLSHQEQALTEDSENNEDNFSTTPSSDMTTQPSTVNFPSLSFLTADTEQPANEGNTFFKDYSNSSGPKSNFSRFELYHDEDKIVQPIIRVKRINLPNNGEKWKITQDNKLIFTLEGSKLSKKERSYLQTPDGFNFILSQAKAGITSLHGFRQALKSFLPDKK